MMGSWWLIEGDRVSHSSRKVKMSKILPARVTSPARRRFVPHVSKNKMRTNRGGLISTDRHVIYYNMLNA